MTPGSPYPPGTQLLHKPGPSLEVVLRVQQHSPTPIDLGGTYTCAVLSGPAEYVNLRFLQVYADSVTLAPKDAYTPYPPGSVLSYESAHGRILFTVRSYEEALGVYLVVTISASGQIEAAAVPKEKVTLVQLPLEPHG